LDESLGVYFDDLTDFLNKQWSILESFRDTIEGLHVTLESVTNQRTTQTISFLTFISVGLMPFTLLSSIYGMNLIHLPYADHPIVIWSLFGLIGLLTMFFIAYMRRKQWL
jgi:Mg2+ and Co2+ transporter CorA